MHHAQHPDLRLRLHTAAAWSSLETLINCHNRATISGTGYCSVPTHCCAAVHWPSASAAGNSSRMRVETVGS